MPIKRVAQNPSMGTCTPRSRSGFHVPIVCRETLCGMPTLSWAILHVFDDIAYRFGPQIGGRPGDGHFDLDTRRRSLYRPWYAFIPRPPYPYLRAPPLGGDLGYAQALSSSAH